METSSSVTYDKTTANSFPIESRGPNSQAQLSPEELRILRECNRESFYYRCLPLAFAGMAVTYIGFQRGILTGHPRWGPSLKMTAAAFAGWVLGKFSYRTKCEDKFLHVQNSVLGDAIRKKRGYVVSRYENEGSPFSGEQDLTTKDNSYASYSSGGDFHSSSGSLNFDANVPSSELDDRNRPSMDNEGDTSAQTQSPKQFTTYEELRLRNREEYERQHRQPQQPAKPDVYRRPFDSFSYEKQRKTSLESQDNTPKNAYGDAWDNAKFT